MSGSAEEVGIALDWSELTMSSSVTVVSGLLLILLGGVRFITIVQHITQCDLGIGGLLLGLAHSSLVLCVNGAWFPGLNDCSGLADTSLCGIHLVVGGIVVVTVTVVSV